MNSLTAYTTAELVTDCPMCTAPSGEPCRPSGITGPHLARTAAAKTLRVGDRVADAHTLRETGTVVAIDASGYPTGAPRIVWDRGSAALTYNADSVKLILRPCTDADRLDILMRAHHCRTDR